MAKYDRVDLAMTADGDLIIENGDLKLARNQEFVAQSFRNRIRTSDPDWYDNIIKDIGANLEDLRGYPNTVETAELGVSMIAACLTRDSLIDPDDLYVKPVPFNKATIAFFVFVNSPFDSEPIGFEVQLNLTTGLTVRGA